MNFARQRQVWGALIISSALLSGCAGKPPASIGVTGDRLAPCPDRPNCVSSMAEDEAHFIDPFTYATDRSIALETLVAVLGSQPRAKIVTQTRDYLHVEFKSKLFGFVDDVEFYFPQEPGVIHVRSASRVGYSDLGVNKKRVNQLRSLFSKALSDR